MNKEYLELYQKLGLTDPGEFYLESCIRNTSCTGPQMPADSYRRQTGLSTEVRVRAIHNALYNHRTDYTYIVVLNHRMVELTVRRILEYLKILGVESAESSPGSAFIRIPLDVGLKTIHVTSIGSQNLGTAIAAMALFDINKIS